MNLHLPTHAFTYFIGTPKLSGNLKLLFYGCHRGIVEVFLGFQLPPEPSITWQYRGHLRKSLELLKKFY